MTPKNSFVKNVEIKKMGLARVINKAGLASRSQAERLIREGRVCINGVIVLNPEHPSLATDPITCDGIPLQKEKHVYVMLNKPRGLVTTANDEQGRETVYKCLSSLNLPHLGPVGRLDKASEGLLLFTNHTEWANKLLDPLSKVPKTYHVQLQSHISNEQLEQMTQGISFMGEVLIAQSVQLLRSGTSRCWIEVTLTEGKNREIRKMLEAMGIAVERLIRVAMGGVLLGDLAKGQARALNDNELSSLDCAIEYTRFE